MSSIKEALLNQISIQVDLRKRAREVEGLARHNLHEARKAGRPSLRYLHLLHAFNRGVPYARVERKTLHPPEPSKLETLSSIYGQEVRAEAFLSWFMLSIQEEPCSASAS